MPVVLLDVFENRLLDRCEPVGSTNEARKEKNGSKVSRGRGRGYQAGVWGIENGAKEGPG